MNSLWNLKERNLGSLYVWLPLKTHSYLLHPPRRQPAVWPPGDGEASQSLPVHNKNTHPSLVLINASFTPVHKWTVVVFFWFLHLCEWTHGDVFLCPSGVYVETQPFPVYLFCSDFLGAAQKPHELESWDHSTLNPELYFHISHLNVGLHVSQSIPSS